MHAKNSQPVSEQSVGYNSNYKGFSQKGSVASNHGQPQSIPREVLQAAAMAGGQGGGGRRNIKIRVAKQPDGDIVAQTVNNDF